MKLKNEFGKNPRHWLALLSLAAACASVLLARLTEGAERHRVPSSAASLSAEEIIKKVDDIRNPSESFRMKIEVNSADADSVSRFDVMIRGNTKTLVKTLEPARDRGRNLLMLGEEMWAYIPNLKRALRVSLSQKLTGQAANGDISRMRWSGDYSGEIEKKDAKEWTILLTAKKKGLTYEKVRVWVDQSTFRPRKSEFLTGAGKALKTATYTAYKEMAGRVRPTELLIQDAVREQDRSTLKILSMEVREFPESTFNQNSMN